MIERRFPVAIAAAGLMVLAAGCGDRTPATANPVAAAVQAAPDGGVSDPLRFVKAAYRIDPTSPDKPGSQLKLQDRPEFSPRLKALFALDDKEAGGEVGRLDFDIYTGTQDGEIKDVKVSAVDVDFAAPPRKVVTATFTINGAPAEMRFYFEKLGAKWFLDDISTKGDGKPDGLQAWTLSNILKYGW